MNSGAHIEGILRITALRMKVTRPLTPLEMVFALKRDLAFPLHVVRNRVVDVGLDAFAAFIGGGLGAPVVGGIGMGPSNIDELRVIRMALTDQVTPTAPADGDVALEGTPVWEFKDDYPTSGDQLLTFTYPSTGRIKISGLVPQLELDGTQFTEEGLFTENGLLIARTTFTQDKTVEFALQFDHTLIYTRKP
jgi:hypothetical protein